MNIGNVLVARYGQELKRVKSLRVRRLALERCVLTKKKPPPPANANAIGRACLVQD